MKTSKNGIELIKRFEGCRLTAYRCPAGKPTIGYGHTAGVRIGQKITQAQADTYLKNDLEKFEQKVMKYDTKYRWNQNEFDALVSFAFNTGSIDKLTALGTRSRKTVAEKMLQYNKAGGKVLSGLTERRQAEQELFLKPAQPTMQAASADLETSQHVQPNYQPGKDYTVAVDGLRIRTKKADQDPAVLLNGDIIGTLARGQTIRNQATARVGNQIWMYFGLDRRGREQWACADNGDKVYIR